MRKKNHFFSALFLFFAIVTLLTGCSISPVTNDQIDNQSQTDVNVEQMINHETGGTITFNESVRLTIPPNSLGQDTLISIEKIDTLPEGESDGMSSFGQAYRLLPKGTQFNPSNPAVLEIMYNRQEISAHTLQEETIQFYYYDNDQARYVNVNSKVDTTKGKIIAFLEHFTIYLPMAQSMVPGNNAPFAALQNPYPNPVRAGAPLYIRATASDFDIGGSVAGVKLYYRKLQPFPGSYQVTNMIVDNRENVLNTYGYLISETFLTSADLGAGDDLEYYVEVTDNLGAVTISAVTSLDVTRTFTPGSVNINPSSQNMSAGFSRYFTVRALDNLSASFVFVPQMIEITNQIGTFENRLVNGVLFKAEKSAVGTLTAGFGSETGSATITVFNGGLDRIEILDELSQPVSGTIEVKRDGQYQLDALGYDIHNNMVAILPVWSCDAAIGTINQDGLFEATSDIVSGDITITLGNHSDTVPVSIVDEWSLMGGSLNIGDNNIAWFPTINSDGSTPWVVWQEQTGSMFELVVKKWFGNNWSQIGTKLNISQSSNYQHDVEFIGSTPYVIWCEHPSPFSIYAKYWNGLDWVQMGSGKLNSGTAVRPQLAGDSSGLYAAWEEQVSGKYNIFVKQWNGSAWLAMGGSLNSNTANNATSIRMTIHNTVPYITYSETIGSTSRVYVKFWNGTGWQQLGPALNLNSSINSSYPSIAFQANTPYVTFSEETGGVYQVVVRHWDGLVWTTDSTSLNINAADRAVTPRICIDGAAMYIVWFEGSNPNSQLYVKHYDGSAWVSDGTGLKVNTGIIMSSPEMTLINGNPYVTWYEQAGWSRIYVKSLQ